MIDESTAVEKIDALGVRVNLYLASLLRKGNTYVKLSGTHRLPMDPVGGARDPAKIQPFDRIDDLASLERLHDWVGNEALFRKILVDNPARLYDF